MSYFLGLDAGGTKTRAVIIDETSRIVAEASAGPANYHNSGLEVVTKNVYRAILDVSSKAFVDIADLTWCGIGIAGCETKKDYQTLLTSFTTGEMSPLAPKLTVVSDARIGLYSGITPPGIVVICGTGSHVYGINDHGEVASAGNWGYFLGDRGSGYMLAKRLFETVVSVSDGYGEPTLLTQKLENRLGFSSSEALLDWYNETKPSIHEISDFAPLVLEAAEAGDEVAKNLVEKTVKELGKALLAVTKHLKMEEEPNRVVIVGGLFESKYFQALFEGHMTALLKHARIVKPLVPLSVGAALMAKHEWEKTSLKAK